VAALSQAELVEMVVALLSRVEALEAENQRLRAELAKNSGNSSKPPSRDPATERSRQAEARRAKRSREGKVRRPGKQPGSDGTTLAMVENPDEVVVHAPVVCAGCGGSLADAEITATARRQVVDLPVVTPTVTEHQAQTRRCGCCGATSSATFPDGVRAPVSYGPRVKAIVVYLLARQHIPVARAQEAMADLFGLKISAGTIDACYAEAGRRLKGFIAALVAFLRTLPVLHADETTDRIGTVTCWMHVVSTASFTLIHASATRGLEAVRTAGVLIGYRGVIVHDRLALYWKLTAARHGICSAHLLRDLAQAATVATQKTWAEGLAALLVEINTACDDARHRGLKTLAPATRNAFTARYDQLVADGLAANPDPPPGRKRDALARQSYNLAVAFRTHKKPILAFMNNLAVGMTNNQAERDLRPVKLHRKISSCFKSQAGAERFAHVRSYLSTTRKHDIAALDALTELFTDNPWMPPAAHAA
jgi:transposase